MDSGGERWDWRLERELQVGKEREKKVEREKKEAMG